MSLNQDLQKKQMVESIWLHYFNQELYKRNIITEQERNKMSLQIDRRDTPTHKSKTQRHREDDLSR